MKTKVEICHIDSNRCVVRVSGVDGEQNVGSSLGEGSDAEEAEDRARQRLEQRHLNEKENKEPKRNLQAPSKKLAEPQVQQARSADVLGNNDSNQASAIPEKNNVPQTVSTPEPSEAPTDPEDWSDELTAIDLELKRIGWSRDQEKKYLERAYGHGSRHKITRYSDLISFLNKLKSLEVGAEAISAPTPLRRSDLITQGDEILTTLEWEQERAKTFLQSKLGATSRQQLSDEQLFEFNMLLEEQLIAART